jgi:predicted ATP-binding protein involved in virulence
VKLSKLRLENFRCFVDLELELHPQLTVLVAENGQGKTTLLDAIRIALWPYVSRFDLARNAFNAPGNAIAIDDVRLLKLSSSDMARQLPARVSMTGDFGPGQEKTWIRYRESEARATKTKDDGATSFMKQWAGVIQEQIRNPEKSTLDLTVFGYYGTGRLWSQKQLKGKDDTQATDFYVRTFAYLNCLDPASSFKHFKEWFTWAFQSYREQQIKQLEMRAAQDDLSTAKERIQVVQHAIDSFLKPTTGWHTLEHSVSQEKSLVLHHDQQGTLKVDLLSDGVRSVLAMIGDIAYRCIKLNPHLGLEAARETAGVVLIDEVDMHLHPRWQQLILGQLQEAFPRVQFVVTTHSPQVLTTVPAECIRVLATEVDEQTGKNHIVIKLVTQQTQGVASSDVLAEVMGIDPVPDIEAAQQLSQYMALIQQDLHESDQGRALLAQLNQHFGSEHPRMLECQRLIRLQAFKRKLPPRPASDSGHQE